MAVIVDGNHDRILDANPKWLWNYYRCLWKLHSHFDLIQSALESFDSDEHRSAAIQIASTSNLFWTLERLWALEKQFGPYPMGIQDDITVGAPAEEQPDA